MFEFMIPIVMLIWFLLGLFARDTNEKINCMSISMLLGMLYIILQTV